MNNWRHVAIVGVGLIGGSIGLDLLQRRLARRVVGIGRRRESLDVARQAGAISSGTLDLAEGVAQADLIVVCTPVGRIVDDVLAAAAAAKPDALITDAGSTKRSIVTQLDRRLPRRARFVGSHPIAGSEKSGPMAAVPGLFEGRTVVITPTRRSVLADVEAVSGFWLQLGARVVPMSAAAHDKALATVSHLPHLVAAALASSTPAALLELAGGGWSDTTRIAGGNAELWTQILLDNRRQVLGVLDRYEKSLAKLRVALEKGDARQLEKLLTAAREHRTQYNHEKQ